MAKFILYSINIFDSFVFFNCAINGIDKNIALSFSYNKKEKITLHFNEKNSFLQLFQFNNVNIEYFIYSIIHNSDSYKTIEIKENPIPF